MSRWRFSVLRIVRNDGVAAACQVFGVPSLLAVAALWSLDRLFLPVPLPVVDGAMEGLLAFAALCGLGLGLRVLFLARAFARSVVVRASAMPISEAVRWIPLAQRSRYPLQVSFEHEGTSRSCDVYVLDANAYQRIEREGFADVVVDPKSPWEVYVADLYLVPDAS